MRRSILALALAPALAAAQAPSQRVIDRYKEILVANPAEGTVLDRLWQATSEQGKTGALIEEFAGQDIYSGRMVHGLLLQKAGRSKEAAAAFERARAIDAQNPAPLLALARLARSASHHSEAAAYLKQAADLLPDSDTRKTPLLLDLGSAALDAGDLDAAANAWEKTVALSPANIGLRRQLADTYVRNHLGARAIPHLEFIEKNGPPQDRAQALQQISAIHQASGHEDEAIQAIERAIAITGPQNYLRGELQSQLIRLHQRYHRLPELEKRLRDAALANPRDLGGLLQLIDFYERTGDQQQELTWLEKLTTLVPKNADYRLRLARLLAQMDLLDRAAATYDALLGPQPRDVGLVLERARIDVQRNQPQLAGERITALIARSPGDETVRSKALEFYHAYSLHDLAERHLRQDAASGKDDAIVALANFLFSRHRDEEARKTLAQLVRRTDSPERQAAAQFRIAGELKAQNDLEHAVAAARAATDLREDVREYHFLLGELEAAASHYAGAEVAFERAVALSHTPAEALEADQRLYDSLRNQKEANEDDTRSPVRPDSAAAVTSSVAQAYLLKLLREVVDHPTEEGWLRVARWQQWSRNQRAAIDAAGHALEVNPKSIAAHDFLARLYTADPQGPAALNHLRELAKLDPPNRTAYLRRLGQVQLQLGNTPDAMRTFEELVETNPGDLDALNDLALAQQRSEHWQDAIVTLRKMHEMAPASKKREASIALLRAYERLAMNHEAAELLLAQIDTATEAKDRFSLFQDLLTLSTRAGLLDWLQSEFDRRHKVRMDDYFTGMALGRVLKAQGKKAAAFDVLADSALSAPDLAESLPELVREAEELHRFESAIQLQSQYLRIVPQLTPDGFERLAQLQEKNLQAEEAAKTWKRMTSKFPRDVRVLERAATFERTWGSPARAIACLRRVREIEPSNLRALAQLAELSLAEGDPALAVECLEQVLAQLPPENPDEPIRYPAVKPDDPSRLEIAYRTTVRRRAGLPSDEALRALRTFWLEKTNDSKQPSDRITRLEVVRELAQVVGAQSDAAGLARWVERWRKPGTGVSERLWALYFAGASDPLLDEVEALMKKSPEEDGAVNGFVWLALETSEFERLAAWARDKSRTPVERDFLMIALEQYLGEHPGRVPPQLQEKLFPGNQRIRLWQAASNFAQHGHYQEAVQLGSRVLEPLITQRAAVGVDLAQWKLMLGDIQGARAILRESRGGTGESYTAPQYQALRALHLLLPKAERTAFAAEIEASLHEEKSPLHATLTRALLAGLADDEKAAEQHLDALLNLRAISAAIGDESDTAATRYWDFLLTTGAQLVAWQLDDLAMHLWHEALADEASIALEFQLPAPQGEAVRRRVAEVRSRLVALQAEHAEPAELDAVLADYERYAPLDGFLPLAETLESMGANPVAVSIYRRMWEQEPANPHVLRNAIAGCRKAEDWVTLEQILTRTVEDGAYLQNPVAQRDIVQQLAEVLTRKGDIEKARAVLSDVAERPTPDTRILMRIANLDERAKQPLEAEKIYRRVLTLEPANVTARIALAALFETAGKLPEAIEALEHGAGPGIDARLALLNFKAGRRDEALAALERVPPNEHPHAALTLAEFLNAKGDVSQAQLILRASLARTGDDTQAYALEARLVQYLSAETDPAIVQREFRRLARFAAGERVDRLAYYELAVREAGRLGLSGQHRAALTREWDAGRGEAAAGLALMLLQQRDEALATWRQLAAHPSLDGALAKRAAAVLGDKGCAVEAADALGLAARIDPLESQNLTAWAKALADLGRKKEALQVASELEARSVFNPPLVVPTAETFQAIGERGRARELYARAAAADPTGQRSEVHIALATLQVQAGDLSAARRTLRIAARNPAAQLTEPVIAYLTAAGRVAQFEEETASLPLAPEARQAIRRAVLDAHLAAGHAEAALALAEEHLELVDAASCKALRTAADPVRTAALIEKALSQRTIPGAAPELALLYAAMAARELDSLQADAALPLLRRAHELDHALWTAAEPLARLQVERNTSADAARTLREFLASTTDQAAREKARAMLSRISPP